MNVIIFDRDEIGGGNFGHFIVIYPHTKIGDDFYIGDFTHIRENCTIGDNVSIGSHCAIEDGVTIGDNVRIHSGCFLPRHTVIHDNTWIGPNVTFTNDKHPNTGRENREGVTVKMGSVIGANVTLLPGVTIHEFAMVGAGAVVTKDVMPACTVIGNPAKDIEDEDYYGQSILMLKRKVAKLEARVYGYTLMDLDDD